MITVFTEGVFDLLHANHLRLLHEARAMGDRLIVGVTPDDHAAAYKRRPILTLAERMDTVRATGLADLVVDCPTMFGATLTDAFLDRHGIGLVVYAGTGWDDFYRAAIDRGILRRLPYHEGVNTSTIIARIRARDDL
ncbi:adenylyltransferase/cytidyltransferase family protein [Rhodobacterales bacterium HKCCSP123]|nr:adenylyltransferase/cytidyltransferase family protein [Rhodobacterales bacterium HKCCSP123]